MVQEFIRYLDESLFTLGISIISVFPNSEWGYSSSINSSFFNSFSIFLLGFFAINDLTSLSVTLPSLSLPSTLVISTPSSLANFLTFGEASPKVRKFARELGVDITKVEGSERLGRVTESDVKSFIAKKPKRNIEKELKKDELIELEYPHSEFGKTEIMDIPRVKRLSSKYLINSWTNIPHVTNHDEADITELEEFRTSLTDIYTGEKKKLLL